MLYEPREKGQGLAEYAFILSLIALAVIGAVTLFGTALRDYYQRVIDAWPA